MRLGWELSYAERLTRPTDLRNPDAYQYHKLMTRLERLYLRVFGIPSTVKQQQAREVFKILKQLSFSNVLDIGCAHGHYSIRIARKYPRSKVKGIDTDETQLNIGKSIKQKFRLANLTFEKRDIIEGLTGEKYDLILLLQVIEHLEKDETALKKIRALTNNNGCLIITAPNIESSIIEWNKRYIRVEGHHRDGYRSVDLVRMVRKSGFTIEQVEYLSGDIGSLIERLEKYFEINLFLVFPLLYPFLCCLTLLDDRFRAKSEKHTSGILIVASARRREESNRRARD